jgi:hypothetical protein
VIFFVHFLRTRFLLRLVLKSAQPAWLKVLAVVFPFAAVAWSDAREPGLVLRALAASLLSRCHKRSGPPPNR